MKSCNILGTNICVTSMDEVVQLMETNIEKYRGQYICVSNVHTTMNAFRDENYRRVQNEALMAIPDGKPLSLVSKRRGYLSAERVAGPDLMIRMFQESKEKNYRHFFFGSSEETLAALKVNLNKDYPYLDIVGMYSPPFRPMTEEEDRDIIQRINETKPDFVWVALGAPKQEIWMNEHKNKINALMLGVGAAFDFSAGTVKRAPKWIQELCLEWFYRLLKDPRRLLPRYLSTNFSFLYYAGKETNKQKKENKPYRVAMIGHKRIPSREGGVEIVVDELSSRLVERGYFVDAYNRSGYHVSGKKFDEKRGKVYNGIRLITIPTFKNGKLNAIVYSFFATLRALFSSYGIYHYHAEGPCAFLWLLRLFRKNVIVTIHGLDWQRAKWGGFATKVLKYGERQAAKHADSIIVLSSNVKQYFMDTYHRETHFISNGITKPELREAQNIKEKWGLEKDGYILFLARLVPEKGAHYLLEAFKDIQTDKKLVIAGGISHSKEYVDQVNAYAKEDSRVVLTSFVHGRDLEELFSNAYTFVLPSDIEGMAISLLEAMSYGNCCVVSDIEENTEVVEDKAVTFKKGDVTDLRNRLTMLLENPEMVENYKKDASEFICKKYDWDRVTDETEALYRTLVKK